MSGEEGVTREKGRGQGEGRGGAGIGRGQGRGRSLGGASQVMGKGVGHWGARDAGGGGGGGGGLLVSSRAAEKPPKQPGGWVRGPQGHTLSPQAGLQSPQGDDANPKHSHPGVRALRAQRPLVSPPRGAWAGQVPPVSRPQLCPPLRAPYPQPKLTGARGSPGPALSSPPPTSSHLARVAPSPTLGLCPEPSAF